jgi:hypothetical protein
MSSKLRNSLIVSVIAISGVVASQVAVKAESGVAVNSPDIEFNGTVTNKCVFGTPTNGVLGDITSPTQTEIISSKGPGFKSAGIRLTCNGNVQLAVSEFKQVNAVSGMEVKSGVVSVFTAAGTPKTTNMTWAGVKVAPISLTGPVDRNLIVNMRVVYKSAVKPGTYLYTTKLTATPQ